MYCINCGVELASSEKKCPLCGTAVYHPDLFIKHTPCAYPDVHDKVEQISKKGLLFILSLVFVIPAIVLFIVDINISPEITWSGIACLGIALGYLWIVLPLWFKKPNPVVFIPIDFIFAGGYLLYIDLYFGGGWFLSLAFPVCGIFLIITTAAAALFKYLRRGRLYILGGLMFALGGSCMLIEMFINITFKTGVMFLWSLYPCAALGIIGIAFIVLAVCKPLRESLGKRFFI